MWMVSILLVYNLSVDNNIYNLCVIMYNHTIVDLMYVIYVCYYHIFIHGIQPTLVHVYLYYTILYYTCTHCIHCYNMI